MLVFFVGFNLIAECTESCDKLVSVGIIEGWNWLPWFGGLGDISKFLVSFLFKFHPVLEAHCDPLLLGT